MSIEKLSKEGLEALDCLRRAVRKELERKAMLGQYVIISRNGRSCRVLASEALKAS